MTTRSTPKTPPTWLLPLQAFLAFNLMGLSVFMHFVQYPLFRYIPPDQFVYFHNNHILHVMPIIGVMMVIELLTALGLFITQLNKIWISNLILVLVIWIMTGFWQGPMHSQLGKIYDLELLEKLIRTDNYRLAVIVAHALLVAYALGKQQKLISPSQRAKT